MKHSHTINDGTLAFQRGNYKAAMRILMPFAQQGNAQAQTSLGFMYQNGLGIAQDIDASADWYRKAADQGDPMAQLNLDLVQKSTPLGPLITHLTASDFALLEANVQSPDQHVSTIRNSASDFFWGKLETIGWAMRVSTEDEEFENDTPKEILLRMRAFHLTDEGRHAIEKLLPAFRKKRESDPTLVTKIMALIAGKKKTRH